MLTAAIASPSLLPLAARVPANRKFLRKTCKGHLSGPAPASANKRALNPRLFRVGATARSAGRVQTSMMLTPLRTLQSQIKAVPADNPLGALAKILLPGPALYLPALLIPLITIVAAQGAVNGFGWLSWILAFAFGDSDILADWGHQWGLGTYIDWVDWPLVVSIAFASAGALADFIALPALDAALGRDLGADDKERAAQLGESGGYRGVLYAFAVMHLAALAACCHAAGSGDLHPATLAALIITQSGCGSVMLTVVHELVHSRHRGSGALSAALLATVGTMHWAQAHHAHHLNVGKIDDPATARRGETVYEFLPRNIWGNICDGRQTETRRLAAKGIPLRSPRNRMIWWLACPATLAATVYGMWGPSALTLLLWQGLGANLLLGSVDYVEHYGLVRGRDNRGRFERVQAKHSWEANWMATSSVTFRLQRHAHHHLSASTPYQALQDNTEAPQLPASYPAMVLLALVPPLFFSIIDRRLDDYQEAAAAAPTAGAE